MGPCDGFIGRAVKPIRNAFESLDTLRKVGSKLSGLLRAAGGQPGEGTSLIANPATPGTPGYGWQYYNDGTAIDPQGNYYYQGELVYVNPVTAGDQEGDFDLTGPEEPPEE